MNELALFSGAGGGLLASRLLGWRTRCAVEIEKYPRDILLQRQADGHLERFPIWDDVCTFDGRPWQGHIDVVSGGFPCQDISAAGKGVGITGARSGLWKEYARIIGEVRPRFVFAENSPLLRTRGLGVVLQDLAELGYDARWGVLGAGHVGALHKRARMWVLGYARGSTRERGAGGFPSPEAGVGCEGKQHGHLSVRPEHADQGSREGTSRSSAEDAPGMALDAELCGDGQREQLSASGQEARHAHPWATEPSMDRMVNGLADRVDRTKAIGNGQVPIVAAAAWGILSKGLH